MIKYLKNNEIDYKLWDNCITTSNNRLIYAFSWYLDIVCDNWDALIFNNYEAVFPLPKRKKFGIEYIYQPFFCQKLGVFSKKNNFEIDFFINSIPDHFKYLELNINTNSDYYSIRKNSNYELLLTSNIEKSFTTNTRRNINKAKDSELTFSTTVFIDDHISGFKNYRKFGLKKKDLITYKNLCEYLIKNKRGMICGVYNSEKEVISSALIAIDNQKIYYLNGISTSFSKKNGSMHWLIYNIMKKYPNRIFDFEGSNIEGVARFYKGFGAVKKIYSTIKVNKLPYFIKWLK